VKCKDCRFWLARTGDVLNDGVGECRRYAARPLVEADDVERSPVSPFTAWPLTLDDQFCGDFASRKSVSWV